MTVATTAAERPDLLGLTVPELRRVLGDTIDKPFRAQQIYDALHRRAAAGFDEMTDLSRDLRQRLDASFRIGLPEIAERWPSADGTVKYLLRLVDGATVEAVDIPDGERRTMCISSQAGCGLACRFCVTGYWGAGRNLTAGEILAQVLTIRREAQLPADGFNVVFMGMGEPLLNLDAVTTAIHLLAESLSWRRITLSTAGVVPGIEAMAKWPKRPNLAISLHAVENQLRDRLMPINRTYPLEELFAALAAYPLESGRRITFEYILIRGVNDRDQDADLLARRARKLPTKINLIPINPDAVLGPDMVPPDDARIAAFQDRLRRHGLITTLRRRRGDDVSAACGQLRAFGREARGFRAGLHE
ncbi:MAG: 23S rRNA (adenine(2503)-C(2))-methyltransferase RlmN [Thermoanaerobaculia bacterium]|nr:23S rRNA (adenine(2503)-C(2))-methyltransferase RlmN [Thermoanaerobaculia bacterium]